MSKDSKTLEIKEIFSKPEIPNFILISIKDNFQFKVSKERNSNVSIKVFNAVRNYYENIWDDVELYYKKSKISKNENVKPYLIDTFQGEPIQLKIQKNNKNSKEKLIVIDGLEDHDSIFMKLVINAKCPIYITDESVTLGGLNQAIKTELISNNILQSSWSQYIYF